MPTQAFYLLDDDKRQSLIDAAVREFESLPYEKVSIFKIAQNAGISRSGLYYYFKDKEDIYHYLITRLIEPFAERLLQGGGRQDLFTVCREFFIFVANYKHTKVGRFVTQVLRDMKSVDLDTLITAATSRRDDRRFKEFAEAVDLSLLRTQDPDEVLALLTLIQTLANYILLRYLEDTVPFETALAQFDRGLDLIKYGFVTQAAAACDK